MPNGDGRCLATPLGLLPVPPHGAGVAPSGPPGSARLRCSARLLPVPSGVPVAGVGMRAVLPVLAAVLASSPGLLLRRALRLYGRSARRLYVGTNGVISTQDFPRETQYVDDDFPTDFPVVAPFLADLDTSGDRGNIYYRQDDSRDVLDQAVGYIQAGFPRSAGTFVPTNVFIATWEDVGAYQELSQDTEPSTKLNTFQAVIAYNDEDTYTIFLYPSGGLQFLGTRPKESYNVQLELPARVGFSWGDGDDPKRDGLFHSLASSEQALRSLERESNTGIPGVWVFHVGSAEQVEPGGGEGAAPAVPQSPPEHPNPGTASYPHPLSSHTPMAQRPSHGSGTPVLLGFVPAGRRDTQERSHWMQPSGDGGTRQSHSANPSSYSSGQHGVGVEEDVHFNPDVFTYSAASKETCAQHHGRCSPHAFCTDYATGFCCHCRATFYGNGRQCLPEGAVHRLNGKVSGSLRVGRASVRFQDVDLHAYIVGSDGRAYTAISGVPQPAARALLPLLPVGGLFAWLFAVEEPGSENGFSITGAEFTQSLEVTFYPAGETVQVTQTAEGLGPDNYLSLRTHIQGEVPFLPENVTVHITPYKELYSYSSSAVTSSGQREYVVVAGTANQTLSYRLRQNISFSGCPHARPPARQQLSVARAFALFDGHEHVLRYALAARVGPARDEAENPVVSPCHDGTHACEAPARCQPGVGTEYTCECTAGYRQDGRGCRDVDECAEGLSQCGPFSVCLNVPGSFRCECRSGHRPAGDGQGCVPLAPPSDPCEDGRHPCAPGDRARCLSRGDGRATCECLPGYTGDGIHCSDVDECAQSPCHPAAVCYNTPGSFSCRCRPGYAGDGFQCTYEGNPQRLTPCQHERMYPREVAPLGDGHVPQCDEQGRYRPLQCHSSSGHCWCVDAAGQEIAGTRTAPGTTPPRCGSPEPTERPPSMCERWRQSLLEHYGGSPRGDQYVPQCEPSGDFTPLQCHGDSGYCWCVEQSGREIPGTRSEPGTTPPCLPSVAPPSVRPEPRPDVSPPATGTFLLYAQGQQIGYLPLNGTRLHKEAAKTLLSLHGSIVVGIDYDCRERMIYWTDVAGRTISRAGLEPGSEPETIISSGLMSPEGLAVDHLRRALFWTDSGLDRIERARLDGSERRVLFQSDLVNPRAIAVDPVRGNLYWTDWNREAPKIETSTVNGANRRVLVHTDIGLPNGLTFDPFSKLLCWADAGTKHLECTFPDGSGRRLIQSNLNYPFSIISYANHFYHTDWRRDGVIAVNKETGSFTDEYLPEQRSHLYGITAVYPYCPGARK
ncbi:PREDICTED: nidogen-2 [Sturnus vulgaris]|uniref:nidogen-2 n=1 Tax=Sturnus vulgaris TaxID=9172 RepID=UPI00071A11B7|nr:PREDICTED: nidogen-2 [Sturnus vulgaris]